MEEIMPELLYHYCSIEAFSKIIQNKTLRLSEITKSNDSMECQWLEKEIVPPILKRELNSFISSLGVAADAKRIDAIQEAISKLASFPYSASFGKTDEKLVFAICVSEEPDLLSQWRGYADDGLGVSIGFDISLFKEFFNPTVESFINFRKVIYKREEQESEIEGDVKALVKRVTEETVKQIQGISSFETYPFLFKIIQPSFSILVKSIYMKNSAFSEEKEWRLFTAILRASSLQDLERQMKLDKQMERFSKIGVMAKSDKIVYYFDLLLAKDIEEGSKPNWIREIYLGPKSKLSERDVRLLLELNGWDISELKVKKSRATYR